MALQKRARRTLMAAAAGAALITGIAGCTAASSAPTSSNESASISLMIWDPAQKPGVQKAVDGFEKAHPNIKVTLELVPAAQYYTKLNASLSTKGGPDVMWQSSHATEYVNGGALEPLDSYIKKDKLDLSAYPKKLVNLYDIKGHQYGIPKDQDVFTFVYNTAAFKKLGVTDLPTDKWTWDDMVKIAKEIKAKQTSGSDYPTYVQTTFNNGVASIVHQLGGTVIKNNKGTAESPEVTKALQKIKSLQDEGLIPPVKDATDFNPATALISGTTPMAEMPSFMLPLLSQSNLPAGTFHAVPVPSNNGSHATDTNGLAYVMNTYSKSKDADWQLIKYLVSAEGATLHVQGGASPASNIDPKVQDAYFTANSAITGLKDAFKPMQADSYPRTTTQYPQTVLNFPQIEAAIGDYYAGSMSAADFEAKTDQILNSSLK